MTNYNKTTLKTFFENGDVPSGQNYADLIDSQVNLVETAQQTMAGPLYTTEIIASRVSGASNISNTAGAMDVVAKNLLNIQSSTNRVDIIAGTAFQVSAETTVSLQAKSGAMTLGTTSGDVDFFVGGSVNMAADSSIFLDGGSGTAITAGLTVSTGNLSVLAGDVSAPTRTVYASAVRSTNGVFAGVGVVSALGTAQATAAPLINVVNRGKGIVDGTTTGFTPLANRAGLVQYLFNEGASANLWPPLGGTINGLAANAAFSLAASAMVTIVHLTASAMAVK